MTFPFKRNHLVMAILLVGSLASGSLQASDNMLCSCEDICFEDIYQAYTNGSTLYYKDDQYTVSEYGGDGSRNYSTAFIPTWTFFQGWIRNGCGGDTIDISEYYVTKCKKHTQGLEEGCGPGEEICTGHSVFEATLKRVLVEKVKEEEVPLLETVPTVSNLEVSSVEDLMKKFEMNYNLGKVLECLLLKPNDNEALAEAIKSIDAQMKLNSKEN